MNCPLKFNSIYKKKVWGGHRLRTLLGRDISVNDRIGESWEIADHGPDTTTVKNGRLAGKKLREIVADNGLGLLGEKWACRGTLQRAPTNENSFPLLIKLLDTSEMLSVQVHPDDAYAREHEGRSEQGHSEQGKTEALYIIHAEPGARLVHGVIPGTTAERLEELLRAGRLEECLNYITVKDGDVVFIPPGMVHAIGAGMLTLEVSQNSDATYRLFDWNRSGNDDEARPLHIDKALDVLDCSTQGKFTPVRHTQYPYRRELLLECPKFSLELLELEKYIEEADDTDSFHILSVITGEGKLQYGEDKNDDVDFSAGESILMPASLKCYGIQPSSKCRVIKTSVP